MASVLPVLSDPLPPSLASLWAAPGCSGKTIAAANWSQSVTFQPKKSPLSMWTNLVTQDRSGASREESMESDAPALLDLETLIEDARADRGLLGPKVLDVLQAEPPV